jgi:CheY-like chemotaxis protein
LHGGAVEAKSPGLRQGSEFTVRLPLEVSAPSVQPAAPKTAPVDSATKKRKILVVDDNRDSAISLAMLLRLAGHQTSTAFTGTSALQASEQDRPDVILLDIGLPDLNGFEVAQQIRERPWGREVTLVALTGWGQVEDRQKSKAAGFDHHMIKPVEHAALMKLLG